MTIIPRFDSGNPKNLKKTQENLSTTKVNGREGDWLVKVPTNSKN